jgi:hypothetical protein
MSRRRALWRLRWEFMYVERPCPIPLTACKLSVSADEATWADTKRGQSSQ